MTIYGLQMDGSVHDTRRARIIRALLGALYGVLAGTAFVLIAAYIDTWLHPELPLAVDWDVFWARLPLFVLGLALIGAVTCWWNEAWYGLVSGAAVASAFALTVALFSSQVGTGMKFVVLVFILVPIAAMALPIAWIFRWVVEKHLRALWLNWSYGRILGLVILTLLLGSAGGYFMKMSARELSVNQYMHELLQNPASIDTGNALSKVEGLAEHAGQPYKLYSVVSATSTEGFDIRAVYENGYVVECTAVVYPSRPPYLSACRSR